MATTSIKDFGLRVSLSVTKPQLTAKDDKATGDAESANNAHGAGQYRKDLYPRHLVAPITEVESAARALIKRRTIDSVLPSAKIFDFMQETAPFETQFNQAVTVFMQNYTQILMSAQAQQGDMFDPTLYPDTQSLRARFTWSLQLEPINDNSAFAHILAPMEAAQRTQIEALITQQVSRQHNSITSDAVNKLREVVSRVAVTMAKQDRTVVNKKTGGIEVKAPIFRDTVLENITELATFLEDYLDVLPPEVGPLLTGATALTQNKLSDLRDDPAQRKAVQKQAASLLSEIDEMMGVAPPALPVAPVADVLLNSEMQETITAAPAMVVSSDSFINTPKTTPVTDNADLFAALNDMEDF